jgi:hypothetical protein
MAGTRHADWSSGDCLNSPKRADLYCWKCGLRLLYAGAGAELRPGAHVRFDNSRTHNENRSDDDLYIAAYAGERDDTGEQMGVII